jgi:glycosyltransferase involved in cell wall biosynthesis
MALSGIVAATPVIARRFPTRRTALVQNFAKLAEFIAPPDTLPYRERRSVAYVGTITRDRCAEEMIAAIGLVKSDVLFVIAGDMRPDSLAAALAARPEWAHVCYYGRQDRAGVRRTLSEARLGLVLFHPLQTFVDSQPIKLYEYMAAGLPVIAADFPGFKAVVERNGCGICVDSRDIGAIASAIDWILNHPLEAEEMGRRGRDLVTRQFSWDVEAQTLRGLYRRILASRFHTPRRRLAAPSPKT